MIEVPRLQPVRRGVRLGYEWHTGQLMRWEHPEWHGIVVCPTGGGKTTHFGRAVTLDLPDFSMIIVDESGSEAASTFRHRASLGPAHILFPFEGEGVFHFDLPKSATYNYMQFLRPGSKTYTIDCEAFVTEGIVGEQKATANENAEHFRRRATQLLTGIVMGVGENARYGEIANLATVRAIISANMPGVFSRDGFNLWTFIAEEVQRGSPYVLDKLGSFAGERAMESREVGDVIGTAVQFTDFLGNEAIGPNVGRNGISFAALKERVGTVYIPMPRAYMREDKAGGKWLRMVLTCAINELWRGGPGNVRTALILDEFGQY